MNFNEIIEKLEQLFNLSGVDGFVVGYSTMNAPIYGFHVGSYEGKQMIMEGGIHAREYLSTLFLIEEISYLSKQTFTGGIYVIPLVNPDGVRLVLNGLRGITCTKQQEIVKLINNGSENFDLWKANINGVDLNVNFNAEWGKGKQNVFCVAPENFVGYYPNSEREVNTLINFTFNINPSITLSWHTKGEVIYYGFYTLTTEQLLRDEKIAQQISAVNGYAVVKTEGSVGGYSDFVSEFLEVPAFTIEIGNSALQHPLGAEHTQTVFEQNKDVPLVALNSV